MILATMFIAMFFVVLLVGFYMVFFMKLHFLIFATHILIFSVVTLPLWLFGMNREKLIKNMKVEASDPEIAETYKRYLKQWKEPRFMLTD
ncbi:hypothetical protein DRQ36_09925 [bacterium]|nr:MAG: hypothetical protein DRQ36_09925 [bacterium]